jgi:hypothetical protein
MKKAHYKIDTENNLYLWRGKSLGWKIVGRIDNKKIVWN